jgi:hypothetical protein
MTRIVDRFEALLADFLAFLWFVRATREQR